MANNTDHSQRDEPGDGDCFPVLTPLLSRIYDDISDNLSQFYGTDYRVGQEGSCRATPISQALFDRTWGPVIARCTRGNFLTPYKTSDGFFSGLRAGPVIAGSIAVSAVMCVSYPPSLVLCFYYCLLPAVIEFSCGIVSLANAAYHKLRGNDVMAYAYARDGLARLLMAPALLLVGAVGVPFELIRFFVRLIATAVHVLQQVWDSVFHAPASPRQSLSGSVVVSSGFWERRIDDDSMPGIVEGIPVEGPPSA